MREQGRGNSAARQNCRGFAISIDALLATVLVLGVLTTIGLGTQTDVRMASTTLNIKQAADDAFAALDRTGTLAKYLADLELSQMTLSNPADPDNPGIYYEAERLLPENSGLKIVITEYLAEEDLTQCKQTKKFEDCFGSSTFAVEEFPDTSLPDKEIIHGRRIAVMKETDRGKETPEGRECVPGQLIGWLKEKEEAVKWLFQGEPEPETDIETWIGVTDRDEAELGETNPLVCYEDGSQANETAKVTIKARNRTRDPIAIMLAMDKSGSMGIYDALVKEESGTFDDGNCQNEPVWVPGQLGNALQFNGSSNYVTLGNNPDLRSQLVDDLTITFWAKPFDLSSARRNPLCKAYGGEFCLTMETNGRLIYYHGSASRNSSPYISFSTNNMFDDNTWVHVTITRDMATRTLKSYKDGVYTGSTSTWSSGYDPRISVSNNLLVGAGYTSKFKGIIDEVRIYNRVLSDAEISQVKNGADVSTGLVTHLALDESSGVIASDSSGNNYYGVLWGYAFADGEAKWVPGHFGNALSFNGRTHYVDCGNGDSLNSSTGQLTISAWVKINDPNQNVHMRIVSKKEHYSDSGGYEFYYNPYYNYLYLIGGGSNYARAINVDLNTGWHHLAGIINGTNGTLYWDGTNVTYDSSISALTSNTQPLHIGRQVDGEYYFNGSIDDVRIYDRALSGEEIGTLLGGDDITTGLISHWKFNENSGDTATDSAGTNNGTLHNWLDPGEGGCQYSAGEAEEVNTNCPETKRYDYEEFTDEQHIVSYDLSPIYPYIGPDDSIEFIASSTIYTGVCTYRRPDMRLWVERPDGEIESNYSEYYPYMEDVYNPPNGVYDVNVWSDAPVNYFVYLRQTLRSYDTDIPFGGGSFEGAYNPPEQECSNFGNWQKLADIDFSNYDKIYYARYYFYYDAYQSIGGQCGTPRFGISYTSQGNEWVAGQVDNALSFGGTTMKNYVEIPADSGLDVQNFTFSGWFKSGGRTYWDNYPQIFMRGNDAGGDELSIGFYYRYSDIIRVYLDNAGYNFDGDIDLWDTQWHHLAVTYNGSTLTVYVDGAQYASPVNTTRTFDFGNSNAWIGAGLESGSIERYWYGLIDEARLYDRALTPAEVSQIYSIESGGAKSNVAPSALVAHWALDESSGYTASDSSGNGHHGTASLDRNWFTGYCGSGEFSSCGFYQATNGIDGPYLPPGNYEAWGWSDVSTVADARLPYYAYQYWGDIFGDRAMSDVIDNGTCSGEVCYAETTPAITAITNCPQLTGYKMPSLGGIDNWQVVNDFNVSSQLRGLNVEVVFDYTAGTDAVCSGAAMGFQHPIDGSDDPNWYYTFPTKGQVRTNSLYVNGPTGTSSRYNWGYSPPIPEGDYNILGWAEKDVAYSITWELQRIDAAKNAASTFIDNAAWKESDEIGLLAFSTAAALEQGLTTQREDVKNSLALLQPSGETAMADAIEGAAAELENAEPGSGKFIVLLTDGKANVCRGGIACSESQAIADAIDAANDARDVYGIRIYVIGFADQSIIGSYEEDLRAIAMDRDDIRFSEDCEEGALCGKYYYAADEDALQEMYNLIALEIERIMGSVEVRIPVPQGMELSDYGSGTCGIWDEIAEEFFPGECRGICSSGDESTCVGGETLTYYDQPLSAGFWWLARFDAVLPCNAANCYADYVLFPPVSTEVIETGNRNAVSWDGEEDEIRECGQGESIKCHKRIPFKYADLNAAFTYGLLRTGDASVSIDLEISNDGNKNIGIARAPITDGLEIVFYKTDHSNKLNISEVGTTSYWLGSPGQEPAVQYSRTIVDNNLYISPENASLPDDLCSWKEGNCIGPTYQSSYWKLRIEDIELSGCPNNDCGGTIIAEINQNGKVMECPLHNTGLLFCGMERLRFFTIDYYVWVK